MKYKILCWNVNGIRAVAKKGFLDWLQKGSPDVLVLQETKAQPDQLSPEILNPNGYYSYWNYGEKKGYSGVGIYTKEKPINTINTLGNADFDKEGRVLGLEYKDFFIFNIYFPNGKSGEERLQYKLGFYDFFLDYVCNIKGDKSIIVCGDFNTAHKEIDLARPKENSKVSGFLPEERKWMDRFVEAGFIDTFRYFNDEAGNYTWWDLKSSARERNVGWRIDYIFIDDKSKSCLKNAFILKDVYGSDHCPIGIELALV
jgi:exodeoxyribonuclease-3